MNKLNKSLSCLLLASLSLFSVDIAYAASVKGLRSYQFFVGGEQSGEEYINQTAVHYFGEDKAKKSVVMVPGYGLSAYLYTSTPDRRDGWTGDFARKGYRTYATDTNDLAVSGLEIKDFGSKNAPKLSLTPYERVWKTWGFGDTIDTPYADTKYPTEDIKQLYASFSPIIGNPSTAPSTGRGRPSFIANKIEVANTIELLEISGPSTLMVHSMAGLVGFEVAKQRPDLVEALVVIEPVGCPSTPQEANNIKVPVLAVYGDYIESRGQTSRYNSCQKTVELLTKNNVKAEMITLTEQGIKGNTHLMMQDSNSSDISQVIIKWLGKNAIDK